MASLNIRATVQLQQQKNSNPLCYHIKLIRREAHSGQMDLFWSVLDLLSSSCIRLGALGWALFSIALLTLAPSSEGLNQKNCLHTWDNAKSYSYESSPLIYFNSANLCFPVSVKNLSHCSLPKLLFCIPIIQFKLQSWKILFWLIFSALISSEMQIFPVFNLALYFCYHIGN